MKNHLIAVYTIILSVVLSSCGGIKGIEYTNYSQRKFKSAKESNNFLLKHGSSSYSKEVGNLKYDVKHTIARFPYLIDATIVNSYLDKLVGQGKKSIIVNSANGSRVVKKSKFNRVKISQNWDKHEMEIKDYNNGNHLLISVKNKTNPIVKINKGFSREKNFITKSMKDVYGFKSTYKNSEYTELMLETTLEWVLIEDVIKILKLYPNTRIKEVLLDKYVLIASSQEDVSNIITTIPNINPRNTNELKIKYYELSKNVVDLKKAKRLYPEVEEIQIFDICPNLDKLILTSSKEELDYLKTEYGSSKCKTQIDNAIVTNCSDINNCFELAKQYSELKIAFAKRSLELVTSLDDCIKINTEFPEINAETGLIANNLTETISQCSIVSDIFPKQKKEAIEKAYGLIESISDRNTFLKFFKESKYSYEVSNDIKFEKLIRQIFADQAELLAIDLMEKMSPKTGSGFNGKVVHTHYNKAKKTIYVSMECEWMAKFQYKTRFDNAFGSLITKPLMSKIGYTENETDKLLQEAGETIYPQIFYDITYDIENNEIKKKKIKKNDDFEKLEKINKDLVVGNILSGLFVGIGKAMIEINKSVLVKQGLNVDEN